mgnify:CR=1 FL=1
MIHQPVQHNPKRINTLPAVIFLTFIHLRRHIRVSTFTWKIRSWLRSSSRAIPKSPKLKNRQIWIKNILRLDIPVNDLKFPAIFQCLTQIHSQLLLPLSQ